MERKQFIGCALRKKEEGSEVGEVEWMVEGGERLKRKGVTGSVDGGGSMRVGGVCGC